AFIGFAISSTLFLSSLLLADYSKASEEMEAYSVYRRDAIMLGPVSIIMAFLIMITLKREAFWIYEKMIDDLPLLLLSLGLFLIGGLALFLSSVNKKGVRGIPR
ncbi:hypothetical protein OSK38_27060, partial [Escherichia coli]|nr:hypothetical protein [Escherichia coli]